MVDGKLLTCSTTKEHISIMITKSRGRVTAGFPIVITTLYIGQSYIKPKMGLVQKITALSTLTYATLKITTSTTYFSLKILYDFDFVCNMKY